MSQTFLGCGFFYYINLNSFILNKTIKRPYWFRMNMAKKEKCNNNLVSRGNKIQETHYMEIQADLFFLFNLNDKLILMHGEQAEGRFF